ncbi:hypothetical protein ABZV67_43990 [Streptomyces sp. NPDC005065]|uniref:hypothetical protein n=1 Tax=Streptomyces sp. NPDC005065 TaxID=3154461 RepID=UPI0033A17E82
MSTPRRPLGHGPQHKAPALPQARRGGARRVLAAEADIAAGPLYRPGGLDSLQQLRARGVLGSHTPPGPPA